MDPLGGFELRINKSQYMEQVNQDHGMHTVETQLQDRNSLLFDKVVRESSTMLLGCGQNGHFIQRNVAYKGEVQTMSAVLKKGPFELVELGWEKTAGLQKRRIQIALLAVNPNRDRGEHVSMLSCGTSTATGSLDETLRMVGVTMEHAELEMTLQQALARGPVWGRKASRPVDLSC